MGMMSAAVAVVPSALKNLVLSAAAASIPPCNIIDTAYTHDSVYTAILDKNGNQYKVYSGKVGYSVNAFGKKHLWVAIVLDTSPVTPNHVEWTCETVLPVPSDTVRWRSLNFDTLACLSSQAAAIELESAGHLVVDQYAH